MNEVGKPEGTGRRGRRGVGAAAAALAGGALALIVRRRRVTQAPDPIGPPPGAVPGDDSVDICFLHHSTGQAVWRGGLPEWFDKHNAAHGTRYRIAEHAFPHAPYPWRNDPADYSRLWLPGGRLATDPVEGQETLEHLTAHYDVIVLKSCFTASDLEEDEPEQTQEYGDPRSLRKTPANYRASLHDLREAFNAYPNTTFVMWTMPPRVASQTTPQAARLAAEVNDWMRTEWDVPGDNVFLWDFRALALEGGSGNFPPRGYSVNGYDSHPSVAFARRVAPLLGQRIVDVHEGRGDTAPRTGRTE